MILLSAVTNADKPVVTANFTNYLPRLIGAAVTLSSCAVTIRVADDSVVPDASASSRLDGSVTVSSPYAQQRLTGLIEGADYIIEFNGTFSDGSKETIQGRIPSRNDL